MNENSRKILRKEFFKDINDLLELHKRFLNDSEGCDLEYDNWDFVLDARQNMFVKWIIEREKRLMELEKNQP